MLTARLLLASAIFAGFSILSSTSSAQEIARRVAVTIDDLPTVNVAVDSDPGRRRMTLDLLNGLAGRDIPTIGFVNESQLYDQDGQRIDSRIDLLQLWLAAGFDLGNHSYSHPDLHRVPLDEFKADVLRGETITRELLAEFGKSPEYFRHPYLHTGTSLETKSDLEKFLDAVGYRVAPVSIDNSEWIFARAYVIALRNGDKELAARIGGDYVEYMLAMVGYYENQSQQLFGRNISHVLLIHANQLNADWFAVLTDRLSALDYEFVSLEEALEDPAYQSDDTYIGPGGITWIHRWAMTRNVDRSMFQGEPATPDYVLELTRLPEHSY